MNYVYGSLDNVFVTHFNINYALRGCAMIQSLRNTGVEDRIVIFAHDTESSVLVSAMGFTNISVVPLEKLENTYPELLVAKGNRTWLEYNFCLTPFILKYGLDIEDSNSATYLDADLYFFAPIESMLQGSSGMNAQIVSHNFPERFEYLNTYGKHNVGLVEFFRTAVGLQALNKWASLCLESTSVTGNKLAFGDQKYLDDIKESFEGIFTRIGDGENLAPWNLLGKNISQLNGSVLVNGQPLYYFHFSGLRFLKNSVLLGTSHYSYRNRKKWKNFIYKKYILTIYELSRRYLKSDPLDARNTSIKMKMKAYLYGDIEFTLGIKIRLARHKSYFE